MQEKDSKRSNNKECDRQKRERIRGKILNKEKENEREERRMRDIKLECDERKNRE